ncbi:type II toxin-antitoxin system Phd/YefM family antitoxin [Pseudanabaena sp. UWO311]|uniref:type II toxin-antitoxin system Phd/YefM family antitoxin n=1 Tax=Pseudanabaena sp. UWO311 TaxID=2487337 RepID=UPI00115B279E|nr:type II toxin-antitoxin system Phd/YefM family antitoxin [Pseudanabaena sp. UWO311]TYQ28404.1 type II toxin-antitoxin system Phd/YefM family antitoxin [Pseudanabaena sp. UWO311]
MTTLAPDLSQEQYIVDVNGNKTAVILSIELYEQMLEDIHDLAIVAERRSEPSISLAEMKKRLNSHETLSN